MRSAFILLVSISFLLSSCKSSSENVEGQLELFNNLSFSILDGEQNNKPNNFDLDSYKEIQSELGLEIPLFKVIKNEQYKIFIGMPYGMTFEEIAKEINAKAGEGKTNETSDGGKYYSQKWESNNKTNSSVLYATGDNMLYIVASQRTASESISLTTPEALAKRISKSE